MQNLQSFKRRRRISWMSEFSERTESLCDSTNLNTDEKRIYMSDPSKWVCVHVTKFEPIIDKDGNRCIPTTAMATDYDLARATVHVTLNKVVESHMGGNWDAASIVVLAPYTDVVSKNGNPQEASTDDTYFTPNPNKGLVLPNTARIVRGDPNAKKLWTITEEGATYKTDHYTPEEIEEILRLNDLDKQKYEKYLRGDISEIDINILLNNDEKAIKAYEKSKDKKAFLRGMLEEDRMSILNKLLRNAVVKKELEEMGYRYISSHEGDDISTEVAMAAIKMGISGCNCDKGHSCSIEHFLENKGCDILDLTNILKSKNNEEIVNALTSAQPRICTEIASSIINGKPLPDFYTEYKETFNMLTRLMRHQAEREPENRDELLARAERLENGGIKAYNLNLDITLRRQAEKMNKQAEAAINELKQNPEAFAKLQKNLQNGLNALALNGRSCKTAATNY